MPLAASARSRFTREEEGVREPRFVRRRVSGETPTVKVGVGVGEKEVRVRQVPFMDMESPRWASERRKGGQVMERDVPVGEGVRAETAVLAVCG